MDVFQNFKNAQVKVHFCNDPVTFLAALRVGI